MAFIFDPCCSPVGCVQRRERGGEEKGGRGERERETEEKKIEGEWKKRNFMSIVYHLAPLSSIQAFFPFFFYIYSRTSDLVELVGTAQLSPQTHTEYRISQRRHRLPHVSEPFFSQLPLSPLLLSISDTAFSRVCGASVLLCGNSQTI